MGTQIEIAQTLRAQGADYILAVKGNQSTLQATVQATFALARAAESTPTAAAEPHPPACHTTVNDGHGRIEIRHCRAMGDPEILAYVNA